MERRSRQYLSIAGLLLVALLALSTTAAGGPSRPVHQIVFGSNRADGTRDLYVVGEDGSGLHRITFDGDTYFERAVSWSEDGSKIAFAARYAGNFDIYTVDADGGNRIRVTTNALRDDYPQWTADGRILFTRNLFSTPTSVWIVNADGTGERQLSLGGSPSGAEVAPHGNRIVYVAVEGGVGTIHVAQLHEDDAQVTGDHRITSGGGDFEPHWSPDGSLIEFLRDTTGTDNDIYVVRPDGTGLRRLTSTPSRIEFWATWSSDGKEILFQDDSTGKLKAISLHDGTERLVSTSPRAPFTEDFGDGVQDTSLWHRIQDPGSAIGESGGRLVATISGSAVPGGTYNQVDTHIGSQCTLNGDFDYRVNYELLTWPHLGGFNAQLSGYFADASVGRSSVPIPWAPGWGDEQLRGYSTGGNGSFASNAMSGTLRLARKDGIVVGSVASGDGWRPVFSGAATGNTVFGAGFYATAAEFGHQNGAVAFDDLTLSSGELTCPDWWRDSFSDVQF